MLSIFPAFSKLQGREITIEEAIHRYVVKRDKRAFDRIYQSYANDLFHFVCSMTNEAMAADVTQKAWLKLLESPNSFQINTNLKAWLFKVARNLLIDELRKSNRLTEQQSEQAGDIDSEQVASVDDQLEVFNRALLALSFEQREAFCLQQDGFSLHDIARMTQTNQETIKTRLRYAKKRLKSALEPSNE